MIQIPKVKTEMQDFIHNELTKGHQFDTNWKLHELVKRWQALFYRRETDFTNEVYLPIERDPKFKLPWTAQEVRTAIETIQVHLL